MNSLVLICRRICGCVFQGLSADNGIPFSMKLDDNKENSAIAAMKKASRIAAENGIAEMSLDEINAEIAEVRK